MKDKNRTAFSEKYRNGVRLNCLTPTRMNKIIQKILADTTVHWGSIHGIGHWKRVAGYGCFLSKHEKVEERILVLFGYFHDCKRHSHGSDPEHGSRAAEYLLTYSPEELGLSEQEQHRLAVACKYHTCELDTTDLSIKACWDCDRLDIGRLGIKTDPNRLFTKTAKRIAVGRLKKES